MMTMNFHQTLGQRVFFVVGQVTANIDVTEHHSNVMLHAPLEMARIPAQSANHPPI